MLRDGRVVSANAAARGILERRAEIGIGDDGRIACRDADLDARLHRALVAASGTAHGDHGPARVRMAVGSRATAPCLLELSPLVDATDELGEGFRGALLSLIDTAAPPPIDAHTLIVAYGLTDAEADVAAAIVDGRTNDEIAEIRCVSADTVKSQVTSVLRKCGVRNRVGLVRCAAMLKTPLRE